MIGWKDGLLEGIIKLKRINIKSHNFRILRNFGAKFGNKSRVSLKRKTVQPVGIAENNGRIRA